MTLDDLDKIDDETLLKTKICNLPITLEGTWIADCVKELHKELAAKGLLFKPECYLSSEWLTPDQEPVIGLPFYLAHPRLIKLEKKMMLEAEGDTWDWSMKLLRHEAGHAINYAYRFFKKKSWNTIFGDFNEEYRDIYRFRPYSKNFVRHLENYYAQYHPDEDFAETFSVWLTPDSDWENRYKGWGALKKLRYVDELMTEVHQKPPAVPKGKKYWEASKIQKTLAKHYNIRKNTYAEGFPDFHDENLKKIFKVRDDTNSKSPTAASVLKHHKSALFKSLSRWTGEKKYIIDDLFKKITSRCQELSLVCDESEAVIMLRVATYFTTILMNYLYTGRFRGEICRRN